MLITIAIPEGATCLLKEGHEVDFATPFLKTGKDIEFTIPLAQKLGVPASKIFRYMKKLVGDTVAKEDVVASKKTILSEFHVKSEQDGIIKEINHYEGTVILLGKSTEQNTIPCFFKGTVESVKKNEISLKVTTAKDFELKKPEVSFGGEWCVFKIENEEEFEELTNKIIFAETFTSYLLAKTEALGAIGYVSLDRLEGTLMPKAQLKNIDDAKKVATVNLPYCLIDSGCSKMYLYK